MAAATRSAPALRSPAIVAIERLAKMAGAGASPSKMTNAADAVLIEWGEEELDPSDLRERVEQLQNDIDAGIQAAEDYVAEADTDKARAAAASQRLGLVAVRERLLLAMEGR